MQSVNDIPTGLRVPAQIPLDAKVFKLSQADLADLGLNNNLAFTYYKGMIAYCSEEQTRWEWREPNSEQEVGLLPTHYTYPDNLVVFGADYSTKQYNFFPIMVGNSSSETTPQQLLNKLEMSFDWKSGNKVDITTVPSDLPKKNTNNIYNRNGFIGYNKPKEEDGNVVHPLFFAEDSYKPEVLIEAYIHNLGVKIKDFSSIAEYKPTLIISKYSPSKKKKVPFPNVGFSEITWRKGSFKFSADDDPVRLTRVPIQASYQVLDFGQEHYFRTTRKFQNNNNFTGGEIILCTRGAGYRYSSLTPSKGYSKAFVYLQFHIEITVDGNTYLSAPLGRLKMIASIEPKLDRSYTFNPGDIVPIQFTELTVRKTRIYFKHT